MRTRQIQLIVSRLLTRAICTTAPIYHCNMYHAPVSLRLVKYAYFHGFACAWHGRASGFVGHQHSFPSLPLTLSPSTPHPLPLTLYPFSLYPSPSTPHPPPSRPLPLTIRPSPSTPSPSSPHPLSPHSTPSPSTSHPAPLPLYPFAL